MIWVQNGIIVFNHFEIILMNSHESAPTLTWARKKIFSMKASLRKELRWGEAYR